MQFSYDTYFSEFFLMPCYILLISIVILCVSTVGIIVKHRHNSLAPKQLTVHVVICIVIVAFIIRNMTYMANGGVFLLNEKEDSAMHTRGIIEQIYRVDEWNYPRISSEYEDDSLMVRIKINDNYYTAIASGELNVGDFVDVQFLPQSGFILEISNRS